MELLLVARKFLSKTSSPSVFEWPAGRSQNNLISTLPDSFLPNTKGHLKKKKCSKALICDSFRRSSYHFCILTQLSGIRNQDHLDEKKSLILSEINYHKLSLIPGILVLSVDVSPVWICFPQTIEYQR